MFAPDGCIRAMVINAPGAMHDSIIMETGDLYSRLEQIHNNHGVSFCVDSAFCARRRPWLIKSGQTVPHNATPLQTIIFHEATSVRQISEWGVGTFQIGFPRMQDRFHYEQRGERRFMLEVVVRLNNLRANLVGINQIRTTFMPELRQRAHHSI